MLREAFVSSHEKVYGQYRGLVEAIISKAAVLLP